MKVQNFKYVSQNGEKSERKVLVIEDTVDHVAGIDFGHLPADKANSLVTMAKSPTFDQTPYMNAFRRFNKKNMSHVKEDVL